LRWLAKLMVDTPCMRPMEDQIRRGTTSVGGASIAVWYCSLGRWRCLPITSAVLLGPAAMRRERRRLSDDRRPRLSRRSGRLRSQRFDNHRKDGLTMNRTSDPYEDPTQGVTVGHDPDEDPTQGRKVGEEPFEDPTQGREVGHEPDEDATQGRQVGEDPFDDPTQGATVGHDPDEDPTRAR
jgi:hypothetical protein